MLAPFFTIVNTITYKTSPVTYPSLLNTHWIPVLFFHLQAIQRSRTGLLQLYSGPSKQLHMPALQSLPNSTR